MLYIDNVDFDYPSRAKRSAPILSRVSLRVSSAEIVTVMGESGIGKSTLLRLIAGLHEPLSGKINVEKSAVSLLTQDDTLLPFRTLWQNMLLAAELSAPISTSVFRRADELLLRFGLQLARDDLPGSLSGGMRRRVALGRQLIRPWSLLLLDEPFSGQDRQMREVVENILWQEIDNKSASAIVTTHDADSAVAISNRIAIVHGGRLQDIWTCPTALISLPPSSRRKHPDFSRSVLLVLSELWNQQHG